MLENFDAVEFDKRAVEADEVLRRARIRREQSEQDEWITHYVDVVDARIDNALTSKMKPLIDQKIEQALDAVINDVGTVVGELMREIESDIHGLISRLNIEVAAKHRSDSVITDLVVQMKQIGDTLADVSSKIDEARSGENVVALRKINWCGHEHFRDGFTD